MWKPKLLDLRKPSPLCASVMLDVDICGCIHYLREVFSDKWILNPCYLYKATDEVHNSFDLVSCSTSIFQTDSLLFCLPCSTRGFTAGAKSNCAYDVKDCCQYPFIMPTYGIHCMLNIHAPMKYTWPWYAYKAHGYSSEWLQIPRIHIAPTEPQW